MAWYLRNETYRDGICIASGIVFKADETLRLIPQPETGDADHLQCGRVPELFGWRDDPAVEAPVTPQDEKPAPPPATVPEKVKRKVSKLIGG